MTTETLDWADRAEALILEAAVALAPRLGWGGRLVEVASAEAGFTQGEVLLLLPGGAEDLAALLSRRFDRQALEALAGVDPAALKMRERVRRAAEAWLDATEACGEEALRRWAGFLALPTHAALGLGLAWESADRLWRWAGDVAADENHYSKRAILAGVLVSALAVRLSAGRRAASVHLERQIERVIAFETWKTKLKPITLGQDLAAALGRLRHRPPVSEDAASAPEA